MYANTKATTADPVRRRNEKHDQLCAYDKCRKNGEIVRVTVGGQAVLYCYDHNRAANHIFTP